MLALAFFWFLVAVILVVMLVISAANNLKLTKALAPHPDEWVIVDPDGNVFSGETPFKAAVRTNRHRIAHDPEAAAQFFKAMNECAADAEHENERLIAEHGSLNCPACGGSGHVGDVAEGDSARIRVASDLIDHCRTESALKSLAERIRPGSEAAPWVCEEIQRIAKGIK